MDVRKVYIKKNIEKYYGKRIKRKFDNIIIILNLKKVE